MTFSGALAMVLALSTGTGDDRVLLCRPQEAGDPGHARVEAVLQAAERYKGRFLDYGAVCQDLGEGARAARRAGLGQAVVSRAEGLADGSRFQLTLADAESDAVRARRALDVKLDADAVRPVKAALGELLGALPPPPAVNRRHLAGWVTAGVGAAAVAAGAWLAARSAHDARRADQAASPSAYLSYRRKAADERRQSAMVIGAGAAAIGAGLTLRFVF